MAYFDLTTFRKIRPQGGVVTQLYRVRYLLLTALMMGLVALAVFPWDHQIIGTLRLDWRLNDNLKIAELVRIVKMFGKGDVLVFLALLLGACGLRRRAVEILVALVLVAVLVWPLKVGVGRERPRGGSYVSFPSGDAASAAACAVPLGAETAWVMPVAGVLVAAVAAGRVLDNAHYPSDVCAGIAIGLLAGALSLLFWRGRRFGGIRSWHFLVLAGLMLAVRLLTILWSGKSREFGVFLEVLGPVFSLWIIARYARFALRRDVLRELYRKVCREPRWERLLPLLIAAALWALYFYLTTCSTLWDRDEARFARATVVMIHSGNYLYPTFNGVLRPDKPILIYWLMSLPIRLFGQTAWACRFFAPLGTSATALLTYWMGKRLFNPAIGLLAMLLFAATPLMMLNGTAAITDAVLLAFITLALAVFLHAVQSRTFSWRHTVAMGVALGAAQLTKGPVGLAVPLLTCALFLWLVRDRMPVRSFWRPLGLASLLGVGLFLVWAIPANNATHGEFLRAGLGHQVLHRMLKPMEHHGGNFFLSLPYYLLVILLTFFPWTLFLPGGFAALWPRRHKQPETRNFLWGWILPTVILMTFVATKLPHYILPIWPALSLVVAYTIYQARQQDLGSRARVWLQRGIWFFAPVGVVFGLILMIGPWFLPLPGARTACLPLGLLLIFLALFGGREHLARRYQSAAAVLLVGMFVLQIDLGACLLPAVEPFKLSLPVARTIVADTAPSVPVVTYEYHEPTLNFYLNRSVIDSLGNEKSVVDWSHDPGPGVLVIPLRGLRAIEKRYGALPLLEIAKARGYDYVKGKPMELLALRRH